MIEKIDKIEAARRQLDTAIDLYFNEGDSLSCFTLSYASLKLLFDLYPHYKDDDFDTQVDRIIGEAGWKHISGVGNFLKHADRDPEGILDHFDPERGMPIIGLATILYRRLAGEISSKMMAFDCWIEAIAADELCIPEIDQNEDRAAEYQRFWSNIKGAPREARRKFAKEHYHYFLSNHSRIQNEVDHGQKNQVGLQELLDQNLVRNSRVSICGVDVIIGAAYIAYINI